MKIESNDIYNVLQEILAEQRRTNELLESVYPLDKEEETEESEEDGREPTIKRKPE